MSQTTRPEGNDSPGNQSDASPPAGRKTVVLVGLMGAGKSCIGRRLAPRLGLPFADADAEIETAAGCSIEDIFANHGEAAFRSGERRVIERLLTEQPKVLSTGGGAFIDPRTRDAVRRFGVSVWLRADLELLLKRTGRRNNRPLLKTGDPRSILKSLMEERYPVYSEADITIDSVDAPPDVTVNRVERAVLDFLDRQEVAAESAQAALS